MAGSEQRPDAYALLTAGSAVFGVVLAFASASAPAKVAGLVFVLLAMAIIVNTHILELRAAIHERKLSGRTSTVLLVLLLLTVATLSSLPALFGGKATTGEKPVADPATLPSKAIAPSPRLPRPEDFSLKLTSPKMVGPGGQFSLVLQDHGSPVSPISCQAVVPSALSRFFLSKEGNCRDITLLLRGGPLPMAADSRPRFGDPTTFVPSVVVRFGGRKPDLDVVGLEGGEPLAVDNVIRLVIAPESHLVLSPNRAFIVHVRLQSGTMPEGFRCDWSDALGRVWDVECQSARERGPGSALKRVPSAHRRSGGCRCRA